MTPSDFQPLANHLWQSTLFAAAAGLLTQALKNNRAQTRYWLWLAASIKFLIPFSLLVEAGSYFQSAPALVSTAPSPLAIAFEQVSQPFAAPAPVVTAVAASHSIDFLPAILIATWAIGFVTLTTSWWRRWRHLRAAIRAASPLDLPVNVEVLASPAVFEPGVFGIRRPVLLLPDGIANHLTPAQLEAILAHELCHIRRRDNLATALHMTVEAVFWFHPLVWWLGARLLVERERACDEDVLRRGNDPQVYAEGILKICELYLAQPLPCVAGVTGANLKQRIEEIMTDRPIFHLTAAKKSLLAAAALLAIAGPIAIGLMDAPQIRAQSQAPPALAFEVASVKLHVPGDDRYLTPQFLPGGRFVSRVPMFIVIATAYDLLPNRGGRLVGVPDWARSRDAVFDIEATGVIPAGLSDKARTERMRLMLQTLLADRFKLKLHSETKEMSVYALVVGKGGPKLQKADIEERDCAQGAFITTPGTPATACHSFMGGQVRAIHARAVDIADVVSFVENWTDRPLLDKTGIKGLYKFDTKGWLPMEVGPPPAVGAKAEDGGDIADVSTIFEIFDQMGLKMEPQKGRVEVVVVDHIEKPTEN